VRDGETRRRCRSRGRHPSIDLGTSSRAGPLHVITKWWKGEAFRERLLADTAATLASEGCGSLLV
jgi:hypothetical protein